MELTPKQTAVMQSMKRLRKPAGLLTIMTSSTGMDSKAQLKTVLQQLVDLGAVKLQSNNQYRALPEGLKVLDATPAMKAVPSKKPEHQFSELKTHETKAKLDAANLRINEQKIELINVRSQLSNEQENNQALIGNLNEVRATIGASGWTHTNLIEYLKIIDKVYQESRATEATSTGSTTTPQPIETRAAIAHLSEQLSDILDDNARILVIAGETPEIICHDTRYEIPTASDKETVDFLQSLSWISGQRIDEAA